MMQERKASYIASAWKSAGFSADELRELLAQYRRTHRPPQPSELAAERALTNVLRVASALRDAGIGRGPQWTMTTSDKVWDMAVKKLTVGELVNS